MLSLTDNIITYIKSKTTPYNTNITNSVFAGASSEEIMVRADPSPKREIEYMDESGEASLGFAIFTKSKSQKIAREQLETFISILNMCPGFILTDAKFIKLEAVTQPSLVSYNEAKEYVFTSAYKLFFE